MNERWIESLSAFLDDDLPPSEARALEARLAEDPELRAVLDELREVQRRARSLAPPDVPDGMWDGIEARMREQRPDAAARRPRRLFTFSLPQVLAAAAALVLISALGMWTLRGRVDERSFARRSAPADSSPVVDAQLASFDAAHIEGEIAALQTALDRGRSRLDPQTVTILEKNLALIRQATEDAKRALAADPANRDLQRYFADTVANKLDMMKRATQLAGV